MEILPLPKGQVLLAHFWLLQLSSIWFLVCKPVLSKTGITPEEEVGEFCHVCSLEPVSPFILTASFDIQLQGLVPLREKGKFGFSRVQETDLETRFRKSLIRSFSAVYISTITLERRV